MGRKRNKRKAKGVVSDFIKKLLSSSKRKQTISGPYNVRRHTQPHFSVADENKWHFTQPNIPTSLNGIAPVSTRSSKGPPGGPVVGNGVRRKRKGKGWESFASLFM